MLYQRWFVALLLTLSTCQAIAASRKADQKRWSDPAITQRIEAGIEAHRKGDGTIAVLDAAGKPLAGVRLEIEQTGHEFLFGCNAFVLGQLKTAEETRRYEQAFLRLFNFATVPFYWEGVEPTQGELRYQEGSRDIWRRPPPDRYLPWAAKNGITLKGHPLLWHAHNPTWLPKDADLLRELYRKRFREIAERYGDKIPIWEVVNESQVCDKAYPFYSPDRAYVAWAFGEAAPLFPQACRLLINEVTEYNFKPASRNPYLAQVKSLLAEKSGSRGSACNIISSAVPCSIPTSPGRIAIRASCWTCTTSLANSGCRFISPKSRFPRPARAARSFRPKWCAIITDCGSALPRWPALPGGTWATERP